MHTERPTAPSVSPMQSWSRTTNLNKAAALATLGIPVQVDKTVDLKTGKGWHTILLGSESTTVLADHLKDPAASATAPDHNTKLLLGLLANGSLDKADPHHPLLDMLRACAAHELLTDWLKTGHPYHLEAITGSKAERWALAPGPEPESTCSILQVIRTADIKLAAALTVLGCPVVRLDPTPQGMKFVFPLLGYPLRTQPAIRVPDLINSYRAHTLPEESPEHPLLWMMQCLINRTALRDFMIKQRDIILIRAPGTGRASLIHRDSTPDCLDKVRRRLGITF